MYASPSPASPCRLLISGPSLETPQTQNSKFKIQNSKKKPSLFLYHPISVSSFSSMKKKSRGFRLGRKLLRIWRCLFRRCRTKRYLRLNPSPSQSQSQSESKSMTTKLFNWGRCLLARGGGYHRLGDQTPSEEEHGGESRPPKGHLAVYVGGGKKEGGPPHRYMLPVIYFNHPLFGELLREAEDEYGYNHPGGITIPCPISHFERVRTRIAAAESCPSGNRRRLSY